VPEFEGWASARPHPALRGLVARYIGYAQQGVTLEIHRGLPSRHVTLIVSLDEPIRVIGMPRPGEAPASLRGLVGGMHTGPALIAQDPCQRGIHLELDPLGTRALLGVSADELSGYVVDLADLGPPLLAALPVRLGDAPSWPRRFAILDEVLLAVADEAPDPTREIDWAWRRMIGAGGRVRVASLAREIGWSRRHFGERFRRELGLSPKQAARVLRFERANAVLRRQPRCDLAALAVDCGYYDQAHLTNEWGALAGCSPGTWIAEELPFLQDDGGPVAGESGV
jgi:AraC-like DNA-binding protein